MARGIPIDAVRVLLELVGLAVFGIWGFVTGDGTLGYALAIGLPLLVATVWGLVRVPGDPGPAAFAITGPTRLALEVVVFGLAAVALVDLGFSVAAGVFAGAVVVHYALARERIAWLLGDTRSRRPM